MSLDKDNIFSSKEDNTVDTTIQSLGHVIIDSLTNKFPDKVIFVDYASGREWTGFEVKEKILNIASCLIEEYNFKPGDVACISYDCCDLSTILAYSIICAGGTVCCHYPRDPYAELVNLANKVEFGFLFCHRTNVHWCKKLEMDKGYNIAAIVMDSDETDRSSLQYLLNYKRNEAVELCSIPVACKDLKKDIAIILMSSGTTGKPKAIPYSHFNALFDLKGSNRDAPPLVTACTAPVDYVSGRYVTVSAMVKGAKTIIMDGFDPEIFCRAVEKYRIQLSTIGVGCLYNLITFNNLESFDISSLRVMSVAGARIVFMNEMRKFIEKHEHIRFWLQAYGASETSTATFKLMKTEDFLENCHDCGSLKPGVRMRVVDTSTGKAVGKNKTGSLRVASPSVFQGYMDKERARAHGETDPLIRDSSVFDELGFYITGDIGYFSEQESLFVEGREKELLSCRAAKKVVPQELEDLLSLHPAVSGACVVGIKHEMNPTLDCPRGFVKLRPEYLEDMSLKLSERLDSSHQAGFKADEELLEHRGHNKLCSLADERRRRIAEDIMKFVEERLSWEKHLTGGLVILDELRVLRSSGKVDKMYLKCLTPDQIEIYGDRSATK